MEVISLVAIDKRTLEAPIDIRLLQESSFGFCGVAQGLQFARVHENLGKLSR
jgi:hypothetical protein